MFSWFLPANEGLQVISEQLGEMLVDGVRIVDEAARVVLEGGDAEAALNSVRAADRHINDLEAEVRRKLLVHVAVGACADAHVCLRMMSLVKDAERIGDYAKNIAELAGPHSVGFAGDPRHAELTALNADLGKLLAGMADIYRAQDEEAARAFAAEGDAMCRRCDVFVDGLLADASDCSHPVVAALMARYAKRVAAHATNIVSAVYVPLDKLDHIDEPREGC